MRRRREKREGEEKRDRRRREETRRKLKRRDETRREEARRDEKRDEKRRKDRNCKCNCMVNCCNIKDTTVSQFQSVREIQRMCFCNSAEISVYKSHVPPVLLNLINNNTVI